jgi:hypothetical protein
MTGVTAVAILASGVVALHRNYMLTDFATWHNSWTFRDPGVPWGMTVGAFAAGNGEPAVAYFHWAEDPDVTLRAMPSWISEDRMHRGYILVESERVDLISERLQLFVAADDGRPVRISLDKQDARKYFGVENTEFVNAEGFLRFWRLLQEKYLKEWDGGQLRTSDRLEVGKNDYTHDSG